MGAGAGATGGAVVAAPPAPPGEAEATAPQMSATASTLARSMVALVLGNFVSMVMS